MTGHDVIVWTARLSVAFYVTSVWLYLGISRTDKPESSRFRFCWAAAWGWCVIHVLCAFHFQHHWNHSAALKHTAEMTARVVGWNWSGGLYINYVFLIVWALDIIRLHRRKSKLSDDARQSVARQADVRSWAMQWIAAFMMFNATVVFGPPWWIVVSVLVLVPISLRLAGRSRSI